MASKRQRRKSKQDGLLFFGERVSCVAGPLQFSIFGRSTPFEHDGGTVVFPGTMLVGTRHVRVTPKCGKRSALDFTKSDWLDKLNKSGKRIAIYVEFAMNIESAESKVIHAGEQDTVLGVFNRLEACFPVVRNLPNCEFDALQFNLADIRSGRSKRELETILQVSLVMREPTPAYAQAIFDETFEGFPLYRERYLWYSLVTRDTFSMMRLLCGFPHLEHKSRIMRQIRKMPPKVAAWFLSGLPLPLAMEGSAPTIVKGAFMHIFATGGYSDKHSYMHSYAVRANTFVMDSYILARIMKNDLAKDLLVLVAGNDHAENFTRFMKTVGSTPLVETLPRDTFCHAMQGLDLDLERDLDVEDAISRPNSKSARPIDRETAENLARQMYKHMEREQADFIASIFQLAPGNSDQELINEMHRLSTVERFSSLGPGGLNLILNAVRVDVFSLDDGPPRIMIEATPSSPDRFPWRQLADVCNATGALLVAVVLPPFIDCSSCVDLSKEFAATELGMAVATEDRYYRTEARIHDVSASDVRALREICPSSSTREIEELADGILFSGLMIPCNFFALLFGIIRSLHLLRSHQGPVVICADTIIARFSKVAVASSHRAVWKLVSKTKTDPETVGVELIREILK